MISLALQVEGAVSLRIRFLLGKPSVCSPTLLFFGTLFFFSGITFRFVLVGGSSREQQPNVMRFNNASQPMTMLRASQ